MESFVDSTMAATAVAAAYDEIVIDNLFMPNEINKRN